MPPRARPLLVLLLVAACGGGGHSDRRDGGGPPDAAPRPLTRLEQGQKLWKTYCALCHGPEAKGYLADFAPSLVTPTFLETVSDAFLRQSITLGRPGTSMAPYGKSRGGPLTDDDILKIIAWVRSLHHVDPVHADPPAPGGDAARAQPVYDAQCKECHGTPIARGKQVWLANPVLLQLAPDAFLRHAIVHGRPGTEMKAFEKTLTASQIDDLVALIRSWGQGAVISTGPTPQQPPPPPPPPIVEGEIVLNPKGKPPEIHLKEDRFAPAAEVAAAFAAKRRMVIVDARPPSDWTMLHIPGAISIPYYAMDAVDKLPKDGTWIFTYCACPHHASGIVLDELRARGFTHTAIIDEGILFWQQQGYPVVRPADGGPRVPELPGPDGKPVQ